MHADTGSHRFLPEVSFAVVQQQEALIGVVDVGWRPAGVVNPGFTREIVATVQISIGRQENIDCAVITEIGNDHGLSATAVAEATSRVDVLPAESRILGEDPAATTLEQI